MRAPIGNVYTHISSYAINSHIFTTYLLVPYHIHSFAHTDCSSSFNSIRSSVFDCRFHLFFIFNRTYGELGSIPSIWRCLHGESFARRRLEVYGFSALSARKIKNLKQQNKSKINILQKPQLSNNNEKYDVCVRLSDRVFTVYVRIQPLTGLNWTKSIMNHKINKRNKMYFPMNHDSSQSND